MSGILLFKGILVNNYGREIIAFIVPESNHVTFIYFKKIGNFRIFLKLLCSAKTLLKPLFDSKIEAFPKYVIPMSPLCVIDPAAISKLWQNPFITLGEVRNSRPIAMSSFYSKTTLFWLIFTSIHNKQM